MTVQKFFNETMQDEIKKVRDQHVAGILYLIKDGFSKEEAMEREFSSTVCAPKLIQEIKNLVDQKLDYVESNYQKVFFGAILTDTDGKKFKVGLFDKYTITIQNMQPMSDYESKIISCQWVDMWKKFGMCGVTDWNQAII